MKTAQHPSIDHQLLTTGTPVDIRRQARVDAFRGLLARVRRLGKRVRTRAGGHQGQACEG